MHFHEEVGSKNYPLLTKLTINLKQSKGFHFPISYLQQRCRVLAAQFLGLRSNTTYLHIIHFVYFVMVIITLTSTQIYRSVLMVSPLIRYDAVNQRLHHLQLFNHKAICTLLFISVGRGPHTVPTQNPLAPRNIVQYMQVSLKFLFCVFAMNQQ